MTAAEAAVLTVLTENAGRVMSRATLVRLAGMQHSAPRRSDGIVSSLRRMLGDNAIVTVRGRGWMLVPTSAAHARRLLSDHAL